MQVQVERDYQVLGNELLSQEMLEKLAEAFVSAGLDRRVILLNIRKETKCRMPTVAKPALQVISDLSFLNNWNGSVSPRREHPLLVWLQASSISASPREEARVFAEAFEELRRVLKINI